MTQLGGRQTKTGQAVNEKYMFDAVHLISVAATEISDSQLLWYSDDLTQTAKGINGILEQIGRMLEQDHAAQADCVYVTNLAIRAVKASHTTREIEMAIREIRKALKPLTADPENEALLHTTVLAVNTLEKMGRDMKLIEHNILTLDFWQDTVTYEGKSMPTGTLAW